MYTFKILFKQLEQLNDNSINCLYLIFKRLYVLNNNNVNHYKTCLLYFIFFVAVKRRVVVILDIEVLKSADQMPGKIGDPTPYVEGESTFDMSDIM